MDNKVAFKLAHEMTKQVIRDGDDYRTTFGACLKAVKAQANKPVKPAIDWLVSIETILVYIVATVILGLISGVFGYIGILASSVAMVSASAIIAGMAVWLIIQNVRADIEAGIFFK